MSALHLAFLLFPVAAVGDSDGYFCAADNYLAYQLNTPGVPAAHKLFVIPFSERTRKLTSFQVTLPDFQVHDMSCSKNRVEASGWNSVHVVSWNDSLDPQFRIDTKAKEPGPVDVQRKAKYWNFVFDSGRKFEFFDPDSRITYTLLIKRKEIPELKCIDLVSASLYKIDYDVVLDEKILFSRDVPTECG